MTFLVPGGKIHVPEKLILGATINNKGIEENIPQIGKILSQSRIL